LWIKYRRNKFIARILCIPCICMCVYVYLISFYLVRVADKRRGPMNIEKIKDKSSLKVLGLIAFLSLRYHILIVQFWSPWFYLNKLGPLMITIVQFWSLHQFFMKYFTDFSEVALDDDMAVNMLFGIYADSWITLLVHSVS